MSFFITFEGIEGSGKTTQMKMLGHHLESAGMEVVMTREPGGTDLGESVRRIILNVREKKTAPWAELMLYAACRAQVVYEVIKPAIEKGKVVLCDRFTDSTLSYQGYAMALGVEPVNAINGWITGGISPDLTFILDCPPEVGLKRAWNRIKEKEGMKEDRFEREGLEFHRRVREGYLRLAEMEPGRIKVIDGDRSPDTIHVEICEIVDSKWNI